LPSSIQTAPVTESSTSKPFFSYEEGSRRASEGVNLEAKLDLADLNPVSDDSPSTSTAQILADSSPNQTG